MIRYLRTILGEFAKLRKATIRFVMEQLVSHCTDFHEIL